MRLLVMLLAGTLAGCANLPVVKQAALAHARALSSRETYLAAAEAVRKVRLAHGFEESDVRELQSVEAAYRRRDALFRNETRGEAARELALDLLFAKPEMERAEPGDRRFPKLLAAWGRMSPSAQAFFQARELELALVGDPVPATFQLELTRELGVLGMTVKPGGADRLRVHVAHSGAGAAEFMGSRLTMCEVAIDAQWTSQGSLLVFASVRGRDAGVDAGRCYDHAALSLVPKVLRALLPDAGSSR
jgi:hypothetical protein